MKIFLKILLLVIFVVVLVYFYLYFSRTLFSPSSQQYSTGSVCFKENCFSVELAKTEAERERGLMYREKLDENKGMLFIFDKEGIYPFWMKNTLIPLDIIWISSENKVVFIGQNTRPCKSLICLSVTPSVKAKYVLELNAGTSEKIGLRLGDEVKMIIK